MFGLEVFWCAVSHDYEKTVESVTHTHHKCSRCGLTQRWKKPQPPEPREPEIRKTPSGHEYPVGESHDCDDSMCPAGAVY